MTRDNAPYLHCDFCGMEFRKTATVCELGCPMGKSCSHVRCPNCNFEFPEPRNGKGVLARWFGRREPLPDPPACHDAVALHRMRSGDRCQLTHLACENRKRRNTLTVFGLTPGTELTLLQRHPSYVIRVGETELGLDEEIAREIFVTPL